MIYATRSERVVKASEYLALLFPNAIYHVVAVISTLRSRHFYTSLFKDIMRRAAEEAVDELELTLLGKHVLVVKKVILRGKPSKELINYARSKPIDLVALASPINGVSPITPVIHKVIIELDLPIFLYTSLAKNPPKEIKSILVYGDDKDIEKIIEFTLPLANFHSTSIDIYYDSRNERILSKVMGILKTHNINFNIIQPLSKNDENKLKEILKLMENNDLLMMGINSTIKKTKTLQLSPLKQALFKLSILPIILLKTRGILFNE